MNLGYFQPVAINKGFNSQMVLFIIIITKTKAFVILVIKKNRCTGIRFRKTNQPGLQIDLNKKFQRL